MVSQKGVHSTSKTLPSSFVTNLCSLMMKSTSTALCQSKKVQFVIFTHHQPRCFPQTEEALNWAEAHHFELEINPFFGVQRAREYGFPLAHATSLNGSPARVYVSGNAYAKFPLSMWDNIHVDYHESAWQPIYKQQGNGGELLSNVFKLQILYEILTADKEVCISGPKSSSLLPQKSGRCGSFFLGVCLQEFCPSWFSCARDHPIAFIARV